MSLKPFLFSVIVSMLAVGCDGESQSEFASGTDLAAARRAFTTQLTWRGPAPQEYEEFEVPLDVIEVEYTSGDLKLKAWLSSETGDPNDGKKHPAVVYLHGGWAFGPSDWDDVKPFIEAGFVVLMPMLRGENGNPGHYEAFYGEVDDAIAAGRFVSELPDVDPDQVFIAGHSVGAVITALVAMMPSNYKAAAALSGMYDIKAWSNEGDRKIFVFNFRDEEEVRLRNPMAFAASLQIPLILYREDRGMDYFNRPFHEQLKRAGQNCELKTIPGDHMSMVAPAVRDAIKWYREQMKN